MIHGRLAAEGHRPGLVRHRAGLVGVLGVHAGHAGDLLQGGGGLFQTGGLLGCAGGHVLAAGRHFTGRTGDHIGYLPQHVRGMFDGPGDGAGHEHGQNQQDQGRQPCRHDEHHIHIRRLPGRGFFLFFNQIRFGPHLLQHRLDAFFLLPGELVNDLAHGGECPGRRTIADSLGELVFVIFLHIVHHLHGFFLPQGHGLLKGGVELLLLGGKRGAGLGHALGGLLDVFMVKFDRIFHFLVTGRHKALFFGNESLVYIAVRLQHQLDAPLQAVQLRNVVLNQWPYIILPHLLRIAGQAIDRPIPKSVEPQQDQDWNGD